MRAKRIKEQQQSGTQPAPKNAPPTDADFSREVAHAVMMEAVFWGGFSAPSTIDEMAQLCPHVWKQAVRVFGGDKASARAWMDCPSEALHGEKPLLVALRVEGTDKVIQVLENERNHLSRGRSSHKKSS